uniref:Uncharacterized protein n=1 Tax=Glossina pallidipes TaxID=7398 RepID=A0A1A9Z0M5_GLOPL
MIAIKNKIENSLSISKSSDEILSRNSNFWNVILAVTVCRTGISTLTGKPAGSLRATNSRNLLICLKGAITSNMLSNMSTLRGKSLLIATVARNDLLDCLWIGGRPSCGHLPTSALIYSSQETAGGGGGCSEQRRGIVTVALVDPASAELLLQLVKLERRPFNG